MKERIERTLNDELSSFATSSFQRDRLYRNAIRETDEKERKKKRIGSFRPRRVAVLALALVLLTGVAGAAFYPQIISWFSNQYGQEWNDWMADGSVAQPNASVEIEGAVLTIDEVLVRARGLYVLGSIKPQEGYLLIGQDGHADDPFGYDVRSGETPPAGAQTIAQKAAETGATMRSVGVTLEEIAVDGGASIPVQSCGYTEKAQMDGSIVFSIEAEDGRAVEAGREYTLLLCARSYAVSDATATTPDALTEKEWQVTVVPKQIAQSVISDAAGDEKQPADAVAADSEKEADNEVNVRVPDEYAQTGTLPIYEASKRDLSAAVDPEWFNTSGIQTRSESKNKRVTVLFKDEAQLTWDETSLTYDTYSGTVEVFHESAETGKIFSETLPKETMPHAAKNLASWMLFGWPKTHEVYVLENRTLTNISLEEAKTKAEALFHRLGMEGYVCEKAIDMSLNRIQTMGAKWNALIEEGYMLNAPVLDYSEATVADEGYLLQYDRFGNDGDIDGLFHAAVYVTADGVASVNLCDTYAMGEVRETPEQLVAWPSVAADLADQLAKARDPMRLEQVEAVRLTWYPVRDKRAKEGLSFTPVWVLTFSATSNDQGEADLFAVYDAIDGHLINGNWM